MLGRAATKISLSRDNDINELEEARLNHKAKIENA